MENLPTPRKREPKKNKPNAGRVRTKEATGREGMHVLLLYGREGVTRTKRLICQGL